MTTYKRRQTDTIEATQFTSELGGIVRGVTAGTAPDGLEHSEHSGYSFHGQRVVFGDYLVGSMLVEKATFEKQWEIDVPPPTPAEIRAHIEAVSGINSVARGAVAAPDATLSVSLEPGTLVADSVATRGTTGSVAVDTVLKQKASRKRQPDFRTPGGDQ
jgi:hypothetical protein